MIDAVTTPWLLAAIPILGALLGLVVWSQPEKLKFWSISVYGVESTGCDRDI